MAGLDDPGKPEGTKLKSAASEAIRPAIAIVIDDCGVDELRTRGAMALPAAMTLAFLPYPGASSSLSHQAHMAGHEIIVHLPMEPKGAENPGPMALTDGLSEAGKSRAKRSRLGLVARLRL